MSDTRKLAVDVNDERDRHYLEHNREVWLALVTERLRPLIDKAVGRGSTVTVKGQDVVVGGLGKVRVSVGFPHKGGAGSRSKVIGQCHYGSNSADGTTEIFIHPELVELSPEEAEAKQAEDPSVTPHGVTSTLAHELCHAALPPKTGHKGRFISAVKAMALEGKPTATVPGDAFHELITPIIEDMPAYPHAKLTVSPGKPQATRLIKVYCPDDGYTMRITRKWIDEAMPDCPLCHVPMWVG